MALFSVIFIHLMITLILISFMFGFLLNYNSLSVRPLHLQLREMLFLMLIIFNIEINIKMVGH